MFSQSQSAKINSSSASQVSSVISAIKEKQPLVCSITESKEMFGALQQFTSQPPIILPSPAQKAEHLIAEGNELFANHALDQAEAKYVEALKEIYHQEDAEGYKYHLESILGLAKVYEKRTDGYIKSTALYNYALNICTKQEILEKLTEEEKSYFVDKISGAKIALSILENSFITQLMQRMGKQFSNPYPCELHNKLHKDRLEAIRVYVDGELKRIGGLSVIAELFSQKVRDFKAEEKWAKEIRDLYHNIAEKMKKFIRDLWQECIDTLGEPFCQYTMIGLGSLAREEMTPYSDLEFAILLQEGKEAEGNRQYFRDLTNLLHLKIINLGETILPAIGIKALNDYCAENSSNDWFRDYTITPRGFAFDGAMPKACKTPLGRKDKDGNIIYELIQTPTQMALFVSEAAFKQAQTHTLSMILPTFTDICGDLALVDAYRKNVTQILDRSVDLSEEKDEKLKGANLPIQKIREQRALALLKVDLEEFNPELKSFGDEGKLLTVKDEIYRLPEVVLDNLALFYGITENSSWTKIGALQSNKILHLHPESAFYLKRVCSITTALRLRAYQHYHAQRETLSALFKLKVVLTVPEVASQATQHEPYTLEQEQLTIFTEIYKTLLPLHKVAQAFLQNQREIFQTAVSYDIRPRTLGNIAARLCDYQTAANCFGQAVKLEPENGELWNKRGMALYHVDKTQELIKSFERVLTISKNQYGSNHPNIAVALGNLGSAYGYLGDIQRQKKLLEDALAIQEKYYGRDHYEVAKMLINLVNVYESLGEVHQQKALLERALVIQENHYGRDQYTIAMTLTNLGNAYGSLGDVHRQKALLERALTIAESHYGCDHYAIAIPLANLGIACGELGDVYRQKALLERALAIEENHYGRDHYEVAKILVNLGNAYRNLGDVQQAKELLKRALAILKKHRGRDHYEMARTLVNLGNAYRDLGDVQQAKELLEDALAVEEKHYGEDHYEVTRPLVILGAVYGDLGNIQEQKALLERALAIQAKHYGSDHYEVARTLSNLGGVYGKLGKVQRAKKLLERALAIQENYYGREHYEVAITLGNLGLVYGDLGDVHRKKALLERALAIGENHYGRNHHKVAGTLVNLGGNYAELGDVQRAKELLERALMIQENYYGRDHYTAAVTLVVLGIIYRLLDAAHRSRELLEHALALQEKYYGSDYYEVAKTLRNLGDTCRALSDAPQEKKLLERALTIQEKHYGVDHYEVAITRLNLGYAYLALKDYDQAEKHFEFSHQVFLKSFGLNDERTKKASKALQQIPKIPKSNHYESSFEGFRRGFLLSEKQQERKNVSCVNNEKCAEITGALLNEYETTDSARAIRYAVVHQDSHTLQLLLEKYPDKIDKSDENSEKGYTALHLAVLHNKREHIMCLLQHNARVDILDKHGKTAIDYAREEGILALFSSNGERSVLELPDNEEKIKGKGINQQKMALKPN